MRFWPTKWFYATTSPPVVPLGPLVEREREIRNPKWSFVGGREGELDKVTSKYVKSNAFGTKAEPAFSKQRTFLDWLAPRKHPKKGRV